MILARSIINDEMMVILSEGTLLSKAHITRLAFLDIPLVYIKDEYELSEAFQNVSALFDHSSAFISEYKDVIHEARSIFEEAKSSGKAPVEKSKQVIHDTIAPMSKESGVMDYLLEVNHLAADVYNHSVRVSILAGVLAKWMHLPKVETQEVILAGFLHDIGKTRFPERLLDKKVETLTGDDREAYEQHTVDGQMILSASPGLPDGVKRAALQHHEAMDGSGFPFGIGGNDIHLYARMIALADLYDNITTEREGCRKETPFAAIDKITADMYTKLDPTVCVPFLTNIKIAFLGSRVYLSNGLSGTIVRYTNDYAARPLIRVMDSELLDLNVFQDVSIVEYNPKD
ncbi:MAG: HD domain-containing protein [Schwartzia sp.]|nr:HD domain-containing protein [Schwartzia sp. (in: firmicutes)]